MDALNATRTRPAPPPAGTATTVLLPVRDARGAAILVPIRMLPGPRSPAQDAALGRFWSGVLRKLDA